MTREKVILVSCNNLKYTEVNKLKYMQECENSPVSRNCYQFILHFQTFKMCNHKYKFKRK